MNHFLGEGGSLVGSASDYRSKDCVLEKHTLIPHIILYLTVKTNVYQNLMKLVFSLI